MNKLIQALEEKHGGKLVDIRFLLQPDSNMAGLLALEDDLVKAVREASQIPIHML